MTPLFWTILIVLIVVFLGMMYPKPKKMTEAEIIFLLQARQQRVAPQFRVNDTVYTTGYSYGGNNTIYKSSECGC